MIYRRCYVYSNGMFLSGGVHISGFLASISCNCFAIFAILSIIQIAMITSREKVVITYKSLLIIKLTFAVIAGNISIYFSIHMISNYIFPMNSINIDFSCSFFFCIQILPAALLALTAAILFAIEIDSSNHHFIISRGISFYLQVSVR